MKPRELATQLYNEFLNGGQIQVNPDDYPSEVRSIAITQARNAAARIVYHARAYRESPTQETWLAIPAPIRGAVDRYITSRKRPAA